MRASQILFSVSLVAVLLSVLYSGYWYQLDYDELFHAHSAYLMVGGHIPHRDYYSFYTPVFSLTLTPLIHAFGANREAIMNMKLMMILGFITRVLALFFLMRRYVGGGVSSLIVFLYLVDPVVVFTGMQIRPDSMAVTVSIVSLVFFVKRQRRLQLVGALLLGLAVTVSLKVLPTAIVGFGYLFWTYRKNMRFVIPLILLSVLPFVFMLLTFIKLGGMIEYIQQTLFDPMIAFETLRYPVALWSLLSESNAIVFGQFPIPILYGMSWASILLGSVGAGLIVVRFLVSYRVKKVARGEVWEIMLAFMLVSQMLLLYKTPSVFMQYYQTTTWLGAIMTVLFIRFLLISIRVNSWRLMRVALHIGGIGLVAIVSWVSIATNVERGSHRSDMFFRSQEAIWDKLIFSDTAFPYVLFRPMTSPFVSFFIPDFPLSIRKRYPSVFSQLNTLKPTYVTYSDYYLSLLETDVHDELTRSYRKVGDEWYERVSE